MLLLSTILATFPRSLLSLTKSILRYSNADSKMFQGSLIDRGYLNFIFYYQHSYGYKPCFTARGRKRKEGEMKDEDEEAI